MRVKHHDGGIWEKVFLEIGGARQGMIIKGNDIKKPVLLFLSGGPGIPEYLLDYQYPTCLEHEFIVCFWDWRGTGLSYSKTAAPERMTREQFIEDTLGVTRYLRKRFSKDTIFLAAHSFGTSIGIQVIARHPEFYNGYIAVGQMTDQTRSEQTAYEYLLSRCESEGKRSLLKQLIANPFGTERYFLSGTRDKVMHKLGVGTTRRMKSVITGLFLPSLRMADYTWRERINIWRGKLFVNQTMQDIFRLTRLRPFKALISPFTFLQESMTIPAVMNCKRNTLNFWRLPKSIFIHLKTPHTVLFLKNRIKRNT